MKVTQSCPTLHNPWISPGQNTGVGSHFLLQGIFPTQGSNPGLPHSRWILYHLSHQKSPRALEWVDLSLLQQIFLTQGSKQSLLLCKWILYKLNYQGRSILFKYTFKVIFSNITLYSSLLVYCLCPPVEYKLQDSGGFVLIFTESLTPELCLAHWRSSINIG